MTTGCVSIATPASQHRGLGAESPESTMFCGFELCAEAVLLFLLHEGWAERCRLWGSWDWGICTAKRQRKRGEYDVNPSPHSASLVAWLHRQLIDRRRSRLTSAFPAQHNRRQ